MKKNHERFNTWREAVAAFTEEVETLRLSPSAQLMLEWLYASVEPKKRKAKAKRTTEHTEHTEHEKHGK